jgi:cytochrome c5
MAGEKMRLQTLVTLGLFGSCCLLSAAQVPIAKHTNAVKPAVQQANAGAASSTQPSDDDGEQKFEQNCSRCHNAPEELSRRISGTVVLHMRARASLSAADERAILHYLAP